MTARNSTKARRQCFEAHRYPHPITGRIMLDCYICGQPMDPVKQQWEAEHVIARALSDNDGISNLAPVCPSCHKDKTRQDVKVIAKVKRIYNRHNGIKRSSHPMPGSRHHPSKLRRKMNGEVIRWE